MLIALLFACAEEPVKEEGCDTPEAPSAPPTVLGNADDCGWWTVAVGEQLVLSIVVEEVEAPCASDVGAGLEQLYDPIYANMGNDEPKWTFQIGGVSPVEATTLAITCDEGTSWSATVDVTE